MDIKKLVLKAEYENVAVSARVEVLDGVISDFFRMYIGGKDASHSETMAGLEALSKKLLAMQAAAVDAKEQSSKALADLHGAMLQQLQQAQAAGALDTQQPAEEAGK